MSIGKRLDGEKRWLTRQSSGDFARVEHIGRPIDPNRPAETCLPARKPHSLEIAAWERDGGESGFVWTRIETHCQKQLRGTGGGEHPYADLDGQALFASAARSKYLHHLPQHPAPGDSAIRVPGQGELRSAL
jgi:hypothetical protein